MLVKTPMQILKSVTSATSEKLMDEMDTIISAVYRYEIFKPFMDMTVTLAKLGRISLVVQPKEFYALDEGNCLTIEGGTIDKLTNLVRREKRYKITIKKVSSDVVVHEIGHMIEKESGVNLDDNFMRAIISDIQVKHSSNVSLNAAIQQVMITEVSGYQESHRRSELFTRFFQLLAMSKDVAGYGAVYGYKVEDVYKAFPNYTKWLWDNLYNQLIPKIDPQVAQTSQAYIVKLEDIKHSWAKETIKPIHSQSAPKESKWRSGVKSIKD